MDDSGQKIKTQVITGLFWKFMERGGTQLVQFILQIILARLLLPEDYGIIGLISVFISIASIFVQSGFGSALIQKIFGRAGLFLCLLLKFRHRLDGLFPSLFYCSTDRLLL